MTALDRQSIMYLFIVKKYNEQQYVHLRGCLNILFKFLKALNFNTLFESFYFEAKSLKSEFQS